ncbi:hypothetical protein AB0B31_17315 [Catellatospora citrea]|uniref:hypothetical protein n=1 Tax=Catellatospora citrea TaxID=53366 RepID=UPI0033DE4664
MRILTATESGKVGVPSEDWSAVATGLVVVLDGATARTETGCIHGVAWYARHLGAFIVEMADNRDIPLASVLRAAITETARAHLHTCDLTHPGTPAAAVGILRDTADHWEYLVLGDVSIAIAATTGEKVISDERVGATAPAERAEADRYPIGSPEKQAALLRMKHGELAARNREGGYWIAAADSAAADHAITGTAPKPEIKAMSVLTDGAVRAVEFGLLDWTQLLAVLHDEGPGELLRIVRDAEESDPLGVRWPRNKKSDDATAVYVPSP